jgi:probable addiction module antidote protein
MDKYSVTLDEFMTDMLQDEELAKGYLNDSFMNYIEDGDFKMFFKALERVVKARVSIREFAKQAEMDRTNLHAIFNGKKKPQFRTVLKILAKLGYTLRVA